MEWLKAEETSVTVTNGKRKSPWHSKSQNMHISSYALFMLSVHLASDFAQAKQFQFLQLCHSGYV